MNQERNRMDVERAPDNGAGTDGLLISLLRLFVPLLQKLAALFCAVFLFRFYFPLVIAWLIAMLTNPLVRFLERKLRIRKPIGSLFMVGATLAVVLLVLRAAALKAWNFFLWAGERFPQIVPKMDGKMTESLRSLTPQIGKAVGAFPDVIVYIVMVIVGSYLFLVHYDRCAEFLSAHLPKGIRTYADFLRKEAVRLIVGYFRAQFHIMIVVMAVLFVGFWILGLRWALLWAFLIAFLDFLPVFGTGTALIPWGLIAYFQKDYRMAVGCLVLWITTQFLRQMIQPKVVGDSMGISPLATLFLLFTGYRICGIGGMILAVPVGIILDQLWKRGCFDREREAVKDIRRELRRILKYEEEI